MKIKEYILAGNILSQLFDFWSRQSHFRLANSLINNFVRRNYLYWLNSERPTLKIQFAIIGRGKSTFTENKSPKNSLEGSLNSSLKGSKQCYFTQTQPKFWSEKCSFESSCMTTEDFQEIVKKYGILSFALMTTCFYFLMTNVCQWVSDTILFIKLTI